MAILIVDDDPVQCRLLEGMLQKFGYETVTRQRRRRVGAAVRRRTVLGSIGVILDLVMPNLDGLGVLAKLRQAGSTCR